MKQIMPINFNDLPATNWHRELPADSAVVQELSLQSGLELPEDYLAFLQFSNGGGGNFGVDGGWYYLWPAEEVIQLNRGYEIQQWTPGSFGIGSDGGGEALVFDTCTPQPWKLYKIPFISLAEDAEDEALLVSESFAAFIETIGQSAEG